MRKKEEVVQLRLRVRPDLLRQLKAAAKRGKVPLNSEIVKRLEVSLEADRAEKVVALVTDGLDRIEKMLADMKPRLPLPQEGDK
jgi:phytoene/squalene synthetase